MVKLESIGWIKGRREWEEHCLRDRVKSWGQMYRIWVGY